MGEGRLNAFLVVSILLLMSVAGIVGTASASLSVEEPNLFFSCEADDVCLLTPTPTGEEVVEGQTTASVFVQETLIFEFELSPNQNQLVLLPEIIKNFQLDFRQQTETSGIFRPKLDVRIIFGQSVTEFNFPSQQFPQSTNYEPYQLSDSSINLDESRVLWPGDPVKVILEIILDRPGTWELNLRGASYIKMEIEWSASPSEHDVDEPSSTSNPIQGEFEDVHPGALVGKDTDCWVFQIEENEVVRLMVEWGNVPLEIEQPHGIPEIFSEFGRKVPTPEIISSQDENGIEIIYRWRAIENGEYTMCLKGVESKFQPYRWSGSFGYEGFGPTDPSGFASASYYPYGTVRLGSLNDVQSLPILSLAPIVFSVFSLLFFVFILFQPVTSNIVRYGILIPGIFCLLFGGVFSPAVGLLAQQSQGDETTLSELIDERLTQLWDVSAPGIPEQTLIEHTGATFGLMDGDSINLRLTIHEVIPTDDGRYQLMVEELDEFRFDQVIFSHIQSSSALLNGEDITQVQSVRYVLLAGRSLLLDLMILESMLVVDEMPQSNVFFLKMDMIETPSVGSIQAPAWGTRPDAISVSEWTVLQQSLYPERISITLCDCDLDLLDISFTPSSGFDEQDVPIHSLIINAKPLVVYDGLMMWSGLGMAIFGSVREIGRKIKAQELAYEMRIQTQSKWD